jgi:hypothetical protein
MKTAPILLAALSVLAGCAQNPQNAEEFRQYIPRATFGAKQTYEVERPWQEVAKTFQARAPECLNVSVRTVESGGGSYSNVLATYKPTVVVGASRAELHLQRKLKGNVIVPGKEPEGGNYMLVADATPVGRGRTRIDVYAPSLGADTLVKTINGWASGKNLGCPDMTKH